MNPAENPHHKQRWLVLAVIGIEQLMVVLDGTIVNIALPSAQHSLGFSNDSRQWIITAYALSFGGLLLLGGRLGDLFGRKRVFIVGLLGFAGASARPLGWRRVERRRAGHIPVHAAVRFRADHRSRRRLGVGRGPRADAVTRAA